MTPIVNEEKAFLLNKRGKKAERLFSSYKLINQKANPSLLINPLTLKKVYTNSTDKFIELVLFLNKNKIENHYDYINKFLSTVSEVEAKAYIYILTKRENSWVNFKQYSSLTSKDLLYLVQEIPKTSKRVIIKSVEGNLLFLKGKLSKKFLPKLSLLKQYNCTIDCFYKNGFLYVHDIYTTNVTKIRLIELYSIFSIFKYIKVIDAYTMEKTEIDKIKYSVLIKKFNGTYKETYIKKDTK